ncbi:hypothetical protein D9757_010500 [Collybiopsis confluens]|uniref:Uncharacterized protein n=1 Tax=Collybiopsis confluens TaxID=2823264 RepID=A0A8H5GYW8_9AGAR|nr:hypothetical protein D9757_010500 [Collybiopsis confluens]
MFIPPISYVHELIERSGTVAAEFTSNNCLSSLSSISTTSQCTDINNCRTWYDIVWSCVSVLIACTWVSVHPNVPGPDEGALWHKIGLMLVMIIAPELLVLWAARQWFAARKLASRYRLEGWTKTHAFYALMGGFALYSDGEPVSVLRFIPSEGTKALILEHFERSDAPPSAIGTPDSHTSHLTDSPIASDVKKQPTSHTEMKVMPTRPELDDRSLVAHIRDIAQTTLEDMHDRSDSDSFGKLIAVGQTAWFVIQLLTRWIEGLVVTELEVMTLAFAAMSVLIYFFWWDKPQGIQCQVHIRARQKTLLATAQKELPAELVQSTDSSKPKHSTWLQTQMEKKFSITKDNFHQMGVLGKTFLFVVWVYLTLVDAIVGTILVPADDVDLSDAPTQRISSFERTPLSRYGPSVPLPAVSQFLVSYIAMYSDALSSFFSLSTPVFGLIALTFLPFPHHRALFITVTFAFASSSSVQSLFFIMSHIPDPSEMAIPESHPQADPQPQASDIDVLRSIVEMGRALLDLNTNQSSMVTHLQSLTNAITLKHKSFPSDLHRTIFMSTYT